MISGEQILATKYLREGCDKLAELSVVSCPTEELFFF
jgi:hypothetical protein